MKSLSTGIFNSAPLLPVLRGIVKVVASTPKRENALAIAVEIIQCKIGK